MKVFHRRDEPPAEVLAQLPRHERVVSFADVAGGGVVLASPSGLWWPEPNGMRLIAWQHISKAIWRDGRLSVIQADVVDDLVLVDRDPIGVAVTVPRDLPPVVRKRVESNIVHSQLHPVPGGAARFVARRIPGQDGLRWWARLEPGTRDEPAVRAALVARVSQLRREHEIGD